MRKMVEVNQWEYGRILEWIRTAANYAGRWFDAEGEGQSLEVGGLKIAAAWEGPDNMTYEDGRPDEILHMVDEEVHRQWVAERGK